MKFFCSLTICICHVSELLMYIWILQIKIKLGLLSIWPKSATSCIIKSCCYGQKLFERAQQHEINTRVCKIKQWNTEKSDWVIIVIICYLETSWTTSKAGNLSGYRHYLSMNTDIYNPSFHNAASSQFPQGNCTCSRTKLTVNTNLQSLFRPSILHIKIVTSLIPWRDSATDNPWTMLKGISKFCEIWKALDGEFHRMSVTWYKSQ